MKVGVCTIQYLHMWVSTEQYLLPDLGIIGVIKKQFDKQGKRIIVRYENIKT
jgi:hypothetical protein